MAEAYVSGIKKQTEYFIDNNWEFPIFSDVAPHEYSVGVELIGDDKLRNLKVLQTIGIGLKQQEEPRTELNPPIELLMLLPGDWDFSPENFHLSKNIWPVSLMKNMGEFLLKNNKCFTYGDIYTPMYDAHFATTGFYGAVLLRSTTLAPQFQQIGDGEDSMLVYTVIPLYYDEMAFLHFYGLQHFIDRINRESLGDIVEVGRKNICNPGDF